MVIRPIEQRRKNRVSPKTILYVLLFVYPIEFKIPISLFLDLTEALAKDP